MEVKKYLKKYSKLLGGFFISMIQFGLVMQVSLLQVIIEVTQLITSSLVDSVIQSYSL